VNAELSIEASDSRVSVARIRVAGVSLVRGARACAMFVGVRWVETAVRVDSPHRCVPYANRTCTTFAAVEVEARIHQRQVSAVRQPECCKQCASIMR
jgi:hypothetical protein